MKEDEIRMDELLNQLLDKNKYGLNDIVSNFQKDIPRFLYKYRSFYNEDGSENKYWKDYLSGSFHLSKAIDFEDVNDCKPSFNKEKIFKYILNINEVNTNLNLPININEVNTNLKQKLSDLIDTIEENYQKYIFIGCFTASNENKQMWKKYADDHKGFCIEYDTEKNQRLKNSILRVCYVEEERRKEFVDRTDSMLKIIENIRFKSKEDIHLNISTIEQKNIYSPIFIKTNNWSFEKEYRLFLLEHRTMNDKSMLKRKDVLDSNNNINLSSTVRAIYLGRDFEQNNNYEEIKEQVMEIASKRKISVYKINENNECITILNNKE